MQFSFSAQKIKLLIKAIIGVSLIVLLTGFVAVYFVYNTAKSKLLEQKMESSIRECREIGKLLEQELMAGMQPKKVMENLQTSITNTDFQSEFICMYSTQGIQLCHPNPALIGQKIDKENSLFLQNNQSLFVEFNNILSAGKENKGTRVFKSDKNRSSEIVSVYPIKGSHWMLATHSNIEVLEGQITEIRRYFLFVFGCLMVFLMLGFCAILFLLYKKYHIQLEAEVALLNNQLEELASMNNKIFFHQDEIQTSTKFVSEKKRFITYQKDEMIVLDMEEIAMFYLVENTVFVHLFSGKQYSLSQSLEELMQQLNEKMFYRANRQFIINIHAIKAIFLYGKNQLKLVTEPQAKEMILISKNKVADFKRWLEQ